MVRRLSIIFTAGGNFATRSTDNPAVLLLDLKLPKVDGLEVLQQIKGDRKAQVYSGGRAYVFP